MANVYKHSILIVDDDKDVREILQSLLTVEGYSVHIAEHGLSALAYLNQNIPDVIISDLQMPRMSGYEFLSVVRRRFPQVSVIASSGAYSGEEVPRGVDADAFHPKGNSLNSLLRLVAGLIRTVSSRSIAHAQQSSPVWIARNWDDPCGLPYIVLNCEDCLRSFPVSVSDEPIEGLQNTPCKFCSNPLSYIIDCSGSKYQREKPLVLGWQSIASIRS
jgi:CheY-like chemotaxis protein